MSEINKPDYTKSIVNLMSSISNNFEQKHKYKQLEILPAKDLKKYKNIALLVIDGLGYKYLQKQKTSFLYKHIKTKISSVFPATTACANTTFHAGYPSQQTALTGWDMNFKEIGAIVTILPFMPYYGGEVLTKADVRISQLVDIPSFPKNLKCKSYSIVDKSIAHSEFSSYFLRNTEVVSTKNDQETLDKIKEIIHNKEKKRKYIHAYFMDFDTSAHDIGINNIKTKEIFNKLDKQISKFIEQIKETNTKVIIVADHGLIDTTKKTSFFVSDFKGLQECLSTALSGEQRIRHCFVRPSKVKDFEKIVKTKMSRYCWCFKGQELIDNNFFGLGTPHKKLFDRVGDYVLVMKKNYALYERLANEKEKTLIVGHHGGLSEDEMFVPLIIIDC